MIPNRLKIVAATGLLIGGLGAAALPRAFAAPNADATPTPAAATAPATTPGSSPAGKFEGGRGGFAASSALAQFLGISTSDLQTARQNGQTLAQVAAAHGKSVADLKAFLTQQLKTRLDAVVAAGKMTAQQEQTVLNNASSRLDQMINAKPGSRPVSPGRGFRGGFLRAWLQPVAGFLGISTSDLTTALQNGQTLAQIAQAHGKTAADLKAFLLSQASSQIDSLLNANLSHAGRGFGPRPAKSGTPAPTATP
jgi:uncharacterized protein YidB (DUF937 family)